MTSTDRARGSHQPAGPATFIRDFMQNEAAGGLVLLAATAIALVVANSPLSASYFGALHAKAGRSSVLHWINDGLMAVFFLLIGLEVKRELLVGQLASWQQRFLPGVAAVAGMAVPALFFVAFNFGEPANLRGWAIPAATDIAFALGVLALLGSRVPTSLKVLLTAIAVLDDLLAVLVIAVFYTSEIDLQALAWSLAGLGLLTAFNRFGVRALWPYLTIGVAIWYGVLASGVHATLAGVAVAFTLPLRESSPRPDAAAGEPPLLRLEHAIHPWVAFAIVPIFGFANAGVSFAGMTPMDIVAPLPLGIGLGLFAGKQIAIHGTIWSLVRIGWTPRPEGATWRQIYGMAMLCGIGFTMSLFIGGLAFGSDAAAVDAVKVGVFTGSLLAGVAGYILLRGMNRPAN